MSSGPGSLTSTVESSQRVGRFQAQAPASLLLSSWSLPRHLQNFLASKQEQSRSSCGRNNNTVHKPTEDTAWLQPWTRGSEAAPWGFSKGPKDWAPVATAAGLTHTFCACLLSRFSPAQPCAALWGAARQAPLSTGFSRQEHWSGIPRPPPGDLPDPEIKLASLTSSAWAGRFFPTSATWEALCTLHHLSLH